MRLGLLRGRTRSPQHEQLSDCLHGRAIERVDDALEQCFALVSIVVERAHLDEFMRLQRDVDLVQHRGRESMVADRDDRVEGMRAGAQLAPERRRQRIHRADSSPRGCARSRPG